MPANQEPVNNVNFPGIIMPTPRRGWKDIPLAEEMPDTSQVTLHPKLPPAFMVNVGNPHAVIFVDGGTAGLAAQYGFELEKTACCLKARILILPPARATILSSWTHGSAGPG